MSILIKGIDMPKENEIRMIAITSNGVAFFNTVKDGETSKSEKAKAIQIPTPHGRLIDGDKLIRKEIVPFLYHLKNGDIAVPKIDIINAPTILEAEG